MPRPGAPGQGEGNADAATAHKHGRATRHKNATKSLQAKQRPWGCNSKHMATLVWTPTYTVIKHLNQISGIRSQSQLSQVATEHVRGWGGVEGPVHQILGFLATP